MNTLPDNLREKLPTFLIAPVQAMRKCSILCLVRIILVVSFEKTVDKKRSDLRVCTRLNLRQSLLDAYEALMQGQSMGSRRTDQLDPVSEKRRLVKNRKGLVRSPVLNPG